MDEKTYFLLVFVICCIVLDSQAQFLINTGSNTIDFTGLTDVVFSPTPTTGQLDSDQWSVDIDGDGIIEDGLSVNNPLNLLGLTDELDFGDIQASNATFYAAGTESFEGMTGHMHVYANTIGNPNNRALGFRPDGQPAVAGDSEVQPILTLKIQNNTGSVISELAIQYDIQYIIQDGGNTINLTFSNSSDNITFVDQPTVDFTESNSTGSAFASVIRTITIPDLNIEPDELYYIRWQVSSVTNKRLAAAIDNIEITPTVSNFGNASTLTAGPITEPASFSSLTTTIGAVNNFDFMINDDGLDPGADALPIRFTQLVIQQGLGNDVTDWSEAIASAWLDDGITTVTASITSSTMVFSGFSNSMTGDFGFIDDDGSKTYTLSIALRNPVGGMLPLTIDNQNLVFAVDEGSFFLLGASSRFSVGESEESGVSNNAVDVVATEFQFFNTPATVGTGVDFSLTILASDANGNADSENMDMITLSRSAGIGTLASASGLSRTLVSGSTTFTDLTYTTAETFSIDVAGGFTTSNSGSIVAGVAYRTRATGDWTDNLVWQLNTGTGFVDAGLGVFPDFNDGPITIRNNHQVTISSAMTIDEVSVVSGGTIINSNSTITLNNGIGDDLIIESGGRVDVNSGVNLSGTILVRTGGVLGSTDNTIIADVLVGPSSGNVTYEHLAIYDYFNSETPSESVYFPNAPAGIAPIFRMSKDFATYSGFNATVNGILAHIGFGQIVISSTPGLQVRNGFLGSGNILISGANVSLTGTSIFLGGSGILDLNANNLQFPPRASITFVSDKTIRNGSLTVLPGSLLDMGEFVLTDGADNNLSFTINNSVTVEIGNTGGLSGSFDAGGGLILDSDLNLVFDGSGAQSTNFSGLVSEIENLTINNVAGVSLDQSLIVNNDLFLTSGSLDIMTNNLSVQGDINAINANITSSTGQLLVSGSSLQVLNGDLNVTSIGLNNSFGLSLNGVLDVSDLLMLTNGNISSSSINLINLGVSASVVGSSDQSFVDGPMSKITNSTVAFTFPTGKNRSIRTIGVVPTSMNSTVWTAEYFTGEQPFGSTLESGLNNISTLEYWALDRSGISDAAVILSWNPASSVGDPTDLRVARFASNRWNNEGQTLVTGNASNGTITSNTTTSFSPFTLASISSSNPLPVRLVRFEGFQSDEKITLNWTTATEINNNRFEIERADNLTNLPQFVKIGEVSASGNSSDITNYLFDDHALTLPGVYFYRLKQIDFDGQFEFSSVIAIDFEREIDAFIYPNPFCDELNIFFKTPVERENLNIEIVDLQGMIVFDQSPLTTGGEITSKNIAQLNPGVYILRLKKGRRVVFDCKVIKSRSKP